jgi:hypothetical protein
LLQESGTMVHFSEARERGEEEGKLRLLWASVVVFLARKRKRRRSVREYRAHFEPSTSPSSLFLLFYFLATCFKMAKNMVFSCFLSPHFYSFFFGNSQSAIFFCVPRFGNLAAFFQEI